MDRNKYYKSIEAVENDQADTPEGLVHRNLKFALKMAYQNQRINYNVEFADIVSAANEGLVRAAHKYDASRKTNFISYARHWILKYIRDKCYYHKSNRLIATSITFQNRCNKYLAMQRDGKSNKEIQKVLELTDRQFEKVKKYHVDDSLVYIDNETDDGISLENFICDKSLTDEYDTDSLTNIIKNEVSLENKTKLAYAIKKLDKIEQTALNCFYFKNMKYNKISKEINLSSKKTKALVTNAILKMQQSLGVEIES